MSNLRELTHDNHKRVEHTRFAHRLLKRQITPKQYHAYLTNQLTAYYVLETAAADRGLFTGIETISRANKISKDLNELEAEHGLEAPMILPSVKKYIKYIQSIAADPDRLMAHVYVRHMGDLSGGQIIKRFVPGSGLHYSFDGDVDDLKGKIHAKLHDGMATEANICFDMIFEFFEELENSFANMEPSDNTAK